MRDDIRTFTYPDGEMERVELVSGFSWDDLSFTHAPFSPRVIEEFARLYRTCIMVKCPGEFGTLALFHIPSPHAFPFPADGEGGFFFDEQAKANRFFSRLEREGKVRSEGERLLFEDEGLQAEYERLSSLGYIRLVKGERDTLDFVPVSGMMGFPSEISGGRMVVNAHFFLMDFTDGDSPYDVYGTPYGLMIERGVMLSPPLLHREALVVDKRGRSRIIRPDFGDFSAIIDGRTWRDGVDGCRFFHRPERRKTPRSAGSDIVVVGNKVVALHDGGETIIPMAGFVISTPSPLTIGDVHVAYRGLDSSAFGIQVGPAMVDGGLKATEQTCPFHALGEGVPFPPTVFPLSFEKGRAARIGLGSTRRGEAVLLWAEGAGKSGYVKGRESGGASLSEFADICEALDLENIVNLDGGGSAQIVRDGKRLLRIADRYPETNGDAERPVPMVLALGGVPSP